MVLKVYTNGLLSFLLKVSDEEMIYDKVCDVISKSFSDGYEVISARYEHLEKDLTGEKYWDMNLVMKKDHGDSDESHIIQIFYSGESFCKGFPVLN